MEERWRGAEFRNCEEVNVMAYVQLLFAWIKSPSIWKAPLPIEVLFKPGNNISYNITCALREASYQLAHPQPFYCLNLS